MACAAGAGHYAKSGANATSCIGIVACAAGAVAQKRGVALVQALMPMHPVVLA